MENFIYDPTSRVSTCSIQWMENIMLDLTFTTRQVEFRFVRFDKWKILCSIWHIVFSIRKLHLIIQKWPLASLSIRPIRSIRRMENFIYDPTSRVSIYLIRRMENIMLDLTLLLCSPSENFISLFNKDPLQACRFSLALQAATILVAMASEKIFGDQNFDESRQLATDRLWKKLTWKINRCLVALSKVKATHTSHICIFLFLPVSLLDTNA